MDKHANSINWDPGVRAKFDLMIKKIPLFHREIAREVVEKKANENAVGRKALCVEEPDVVRAFLTEVPKAFYSLMIRVFQDVGFDYRKYES